MSTRGTNFLQQWLTDNLPETAGVDVISVSELTRTLFADAKKQGISVAQIGEYNGSVYDAILNAIRASSNYSSRGTSGEKTRPRKSRRPAERPAKDPELNSPRRTHEQRRFERKANGDAWAEKKRKALEQFRAKKLTKVAEDKD